METRELIGITCHCGGTTRRRRYWRQWDRATCKACGQMYEVIRTFFSKPEVMSPVGEPTKRGKKAKA